MPDGPFESWDPADRADALAEDLRTTDPASPDLPVILEEWASQLDLLVTDLAEGQRRHVAALANRTETCRATATFGHDRCDRPRFHRDDHSWVTDRYKAQVRELDALVAEVPVLRERVLAMAEHAHRQDQEMGSLRLQAKMLRGIRERARARREARRG